ALDVERQLVVELRIDRVRREREQDRVSVWRCLGREIGAEVAGRTAAVVDDDRLAKVGRERLLQDARDDVGAAARRVGNDYPDRLVRVALRPGPTGNSDRQERKRPRECAANRHELLRALFSGAPPSTRIWRDAASAARARRGGTDRRARA